MLRWFIWENIEVDRIITAFSFSNYGLIAVQFFNSILSVYYKTLTEHKTVLYKTVKPGVQALRWQRPLDGIASVVAI